MNDRTPPLPKFMYVTPPRPCPYLPGRIERDIFMELNGDDPDGMHVRLARLGFRRSHNVVYRPDCPGCRACVSVRVVANEFRPQRSLRRIWQRNADLHVTARPAIGNAEQFALFSAYQNARHGEGEMSYMTLDDYCGMVENTVVDSRVFEFRDSSHRLVAACLADVMRDGYSAVYSFFDPDLADRSLGTHVILWLIETARREQQPYVYLGYWIGRSAKMAYKTRFRPIEALNGQSWRRLDS